MSEKQKEEAEKIQHFLDKIHTKLSEDDKKLLAISQALHDNPGEDVISLARRFHMALTLIASEMLEALYSDLNTQAAMYPLIFNMLAAGFTLGYLTSESECVIEEERSD